MTTVITHTALGGAKNALTPMCVHIFTSPLDPETKAAARLALEVSLCLPVLLLEPLEAACRGVSSLNPERAFAFLSLSLSLAGPISLDPLLGLMLPTCQTWVFAPSGNFL